MAIAQSLNSLIIVLLVLISAVISVEVSIAVPILEVVAGAVGANLFGLEFTPLFQYLSFLGLVSLMYVAGLEVNLKLMRDNLGRGGVTGITSFLVPFMVITLLLYFLVHPFKGEVDRSVITGIIFSATSLAIVYPILKECGFIEFDVGKVILGSAAFSEVMAMLVFSFFFLEFSVFTLLLILVFFISIFTLPDLSEFLLKRYKNELPEIELRFILVLLLGISTLSQIANVEVAISAFFLGIITSEVIKDIGELEKKLRSLVFGFLSPFFFFGVGMEIVPQLIFPNLYLIALLFAIAYPFKLLGTFIAAKMNMPTHARYISFLFNMPLPLGLLIAVLAHEAGIYDKALYASIIVVILCSAVLSSFVIGRKRCGLDMVCDVY
ncbi:MAG: cation:proton antiporter [Archaeoglobaceae archaeon]